MLRRQNKRKLDDPEHDTKKKTKLQTSLKNYNENPGKENALQNSVVLNTLFRFLTEKDIRSCRLVQSVWNPEAVSVLKQYSKHIEIDIGGFNSSEILEFIDCAQSSPDFPFTKIHLRSGYDNEPFEVANWNVILRFIAPWVTNIHTSGPTIVPPLPTGINFPKLLDLDISSANHSFVVDLVTQAPVLKSLTIFMPEHRTLSQLGDLTTLHLSKFHLLGYKSDGVNLKLLEKFLKSQEETLTELTVHSYTETRESGFRAIPLKNLKTLALRSFFSYGKPVEAGVLFPALTTFEMSSDHGKLTREDFMKLTNGEPLTSVKIVEFSSSLSHTSIMMHELVPLLFPNTKCLKIPTSVNNLLLVFESLRNLTEVEFLDCDQNCSLRKLIYQLTGISKFRRIKASKLSRQDIMKITKDFEKKLKMTPFSALQRIQQVKLCSGLLETEYCELICRVVLNQIKNLKQVHIDIWHEENSQQECFSMLSKGMKEIVKIMRKKFVVIVT